MTHRAPSLPRHTLSARPDLQVRPEQRNLSVSALIEHAVLRREGRLSDAGALVIYTGSRTGRSANDKFIVRDFSTENLVHWGTTNLAMDPSTYERLEARLLDYLQRRELFEHELVAGAMSPLPVRIVTTSAAHALFSRHMLRPKSLEPLARDSELLVLHAPEFEAIAERDGTNSEAFIVLNLAKRTVLIGGTRYAGEVKKSIFSVLNYFLPQAGILPMHAAVNTDSSGNAAIFFGLSGTGKTTLSADPRRILVGDDEHGWGDEGLFNFEGGCYAKTIRLSEASEPAIYRAVQRFGTLIENVVMDEATRALDFNDASITENTRAAYPLSAIPNASNTGISNHPNDIVFLTADAYGVLPPIARLTTAQAMYHFMSGYTAKVAGTERGVTEPTATFSACFGAPFMPLHPVRYAELLGQKIRAHQVRVWLLNTGWTGGPYGVGHRIDLRHTRAMLNAALSGALEEVPIWREPRFGVRVPTSVPGVPPALLRPRETWANPKDYDVQALRLAQQFADNFSGWSDKVPSDVANAGPRLD